MILHFTTVHPRDDVRVRIKEVGTLAQAFPGAVSLMVMDGLGNERDPSGFDIIDIGPRPKGRLARMTLGGWRMFRSVRMARPQIAHFHDPELLPWAVMLRLCRIKVIYDVHEDLPRQVFHKHYIPKPFAWLLSVITELVERAASLCLSAVVVVVPAMLQRFPVRKTVMIANFPSLDEFPTPSDEGRSHSGEARFVYAGGLTEQRGAIEMIESVGQLIDERARLVLLGNIMPPSLEALMRDLPGWGRVEALGWCDRSIVRREYARACAGLVLLKPTQQYLISYPVKLFEYMAAGLPVIASDFPQWREIVEGAGCGLCVDPDDPGAIAMAMTQILDDPAGAREMGIRGRRAVEERYNWHTQGATLIQLYNDIDGHRTAIR